MFVLPGNHESEIGNVTHLLSRPSHHSLFDDRDSFEFRQYHLTKNQSMVVPV